VVHDAGKEDIATLSDGVVLQWLEKFRLWFRHCYLTCNKSTVHERLLGCFFMLAVLPAGLPLRCFYESVFSLYNLIYQPDWYSSETYGSHSSLVAYVHP
jgi:hypothetical protein